MRGYGLPRNTCIDAPNVGDIQDYGRKSSVGRLPEKGGEYKSYTRSAKARNATRRIYKKRERTLVKSLLCSEIKED
jgi:hypothetical protein